MSRLWSVETLECRDSGVMARTLWDHAEVVGMAYVRVVFVFFVLFLVAKLWTRCKRNKLE